MAKINAQNSTAPATPASGYTSIFVDVADKHTKQIDDTGTIIDLAGGGSGSGDVTGPASAVNSNLAAFNLTTGKIIKDSGINTADVANINGFTDGSIPFIDGGVLAENNSNLQWQSDIQSMRIGPPLTNYDPFAEVALQVSGDFDGVDDFGYVCIDVENKSPFGSGDVVVSADDDDGSIETGHYMDMGINGSQFIPNSSFNVLGPHGGYLANIGGDMAIQVPIPGSSIYFTTAGDTFDELRMKIADDKMTIYSNKDVETAPALTDANWTQAGGWGFGTSPDTLILSSNAGPNTIQPTVSLAPTIGVTYRIVITASATSGVISYTFGGTSGTVITNTTITDFITATTTDNLIITGEASATATITAVSVRALVANTGDLFIEGNLKFGGNIQNTNGANVLDADPAGVATFAQIPFGPASDPTSDNQFARKAYVDAISAGLLPKASCRVATTVAGTLATSFENGDTIDGVVLATGDSILIKNQVSGLENGIYTVNASGAPTRRADYNTTAEVVAGTFTFITSGTVNAGFQYVQVAVAPVLNTDALVFSPLSQNTVYTASNGVQLVSTNFSAKLNATGAITLGGVGTDELLVNTDGSSIEISSNALRVKALGITNAMLAGSIADSKLSTISTAGKVLGASLNTLSGIPSGAGIIPAVNLGTGSSITTKYLRGDGTWQTLSSVGDFVGPSSSTDNAVLRFDGTTGKLGQNSLVTIDDNGRITVPTGTTTGGIQVGAGNYLTEQTSLQFIDWQRVGVDYTLMRIKAPTGTGNTHEATISLLIDRDENNAGINEEFIDFYNEHYSDSIRGGIRVFNTGTASTKPFVIGHWTTVGPKDDGDGIIVWSYDSVAIQNSLNVGQGITDATVVYNRFGKANTTTHSLSTKSDVLISGKLEVDGIAYFDSTVQMATIASVGGTASAGTALLLSGTGYANQLFAATGSVSPAAGANGTLARITGTIVEAASGTHNLLTGTFMGINTVTSGVATVNNTATLFIEGPMTATVTGINYGIWVDAGTARFNGAIQSETSIGYKTNAGGTVTQATSKATGVTLNKICGQIIMNSAALAAATTVSFVLTNSTIALNDNVIVNIQSVGTVGSYQATVSAVAAGSCTISLRNTSAGSLSQAVQLTYSVIKSVIA